MHTNPTSGPLFNWTQGIYALHAFSLAATALRDRCCRPDISTHESVELWRDSARTHVLGGLGHLACITDPALVASIITRFVGSTRPDRPAE
jgi:hypothetical protein